MPAIQCPECGTHFHPANSRHIRCSANCNLRAFRARQKLLTEQQPTVKDLSKQLAELTLEVAFLKAQRMEIVSTLAEMFPTQIKIERTE